MVAAQPSRFIAEMALDKATVKEDPREKLKALRAEFAKKSADAAAAAAAAASRAMKAAGCWRAGSWPPRWRGARALAACRQAAAAALPAAGDVRPQQLLGLWRAEFEGLAHGATLLLEQHPEYARERARRDQPRRRSARSVAGDIEDGEFTLEESADGRRIAATWLGDVVEGSCGREIRGTWSAKADATARAVRAAQAALSSLQFTVALGRAAAGRASIGACRDAVSRPAAFAWLLLAAGARKRRKPGRPAPCTTTPTRAWPASTAGPRASAAARGRRGGRLAARPAPAPRARRPPRLPRSRPWSPPPGTRLGMRLTAPKAAATRSYSRAVALLGTGAGRRLRHLRPARLPADQRWRWSTRRHGEPPAHLGQPGQRRATSLRLPRDRDCGCSCRCAPRSRGPAASTTPREDATRCGSAIRSSRTGSCSPGAVAPVPQHRPRAGDRCTSAPLQSAMPGAMAPALHGPGRRAPVQRPDPAAVAQLEPRVPDGGRRARRRCSCTRACGTACPRRGDDDNPGITDYIGRGELRAEWKAGGGNLWAVTTRHTLRREGTRLDARSSGSAA